MWTFPGPFGHNSLNWASITVDTSVSASMDGAKADVAHGKEVILEVLRSLGTATASMVILMQSQSV